MLMIMTKVDAVNIVLSAIGGSPINTLDDNDDVDIDNILRLMDRVSLNVQLKGWDFNSLQMTLIPDALSKRILWNESIIKFTSTDGTVYSKRGKYLFNVTDSTYEFNKSVTLSVITAVDFEDLPQCFREYITAKTAVEFQTRYMGDGDVAQDLMLELQEAMQGLTDYDLSMGQYNMLQVPGVVEVLSRT